MWCCCSWIRSCIDSLTNVLVLPSPLSYEPLSTWPKCISMPANLPIHTGFLTPQPCVQREQKRDSCVYLRSLLPTVPVLAFGSIRPFGLWFGEEIERVPNHLSVGEHRHRTQDYTQRCHGRFEAPDFSGLPWYKLVQCRLCHVEKFGEIGCLFSWQHRHTKAKGFYCTLIIFQNMSW